MVPDPGLSRATGCYYEIVSPKRGEGSEQDAAASLASTAEVAVVVEDVQRAHRGRIRWGIGKHTAELALRALERSPREKRSGKSRRRKRHKRLL
jgi:hypothetical protein